MKGNLFKILYRPNILILINSVLGIFIGINYPQVGAIFSPISSIYLSLLQVTIIPLIMLSLIMSISHINKLENAFGLIKRIPVVFLLMLVMVSTWGVCTSLLLNPAQEFAAGGGLATVLNNNSVSLVKEVVVDESIFQSTTDNLAKFIIDSIPKNFFNSLSTNNILQIVIFTLIFSAALSALKTPRKQVVYDSIEVMLHAFQMIVMKLVKLLPIGIFFLLADQAQKISLEIMVGMVKFVSMCGLSFLSLIVFATLVIWRRTKTLSYLAILKALKDTIAISLTTSNSLAAMPYAANALVEKFSYDESTVNLVMPLGITITRYGNVFYFAFCIVFIAALYSIPLASSDLVLAILGSVLAGITTSGASGILTLNMLSIVADPLGIPISGVLILFIAIDPLIDPMRTLTNSMLCAMATCILSKKDSYTHDNLPSHETGEIFNQTAS